MYWHWQRTLRGRLAGARYFQPFSPANAYDATADAVTAAIEIDLRARARMAHASGLRPDAVEEPDGEVLVYVGHRVHSLVSRTLERLKAVENDLEDPDLLADLYGIDHLVTQMRRAAERSAVLGGRTARRAAAPMPISTVLRQAMAEVEAFDRVRLRLPDDDVEVPGYAGPDVIHVLAELVENATRFSRPDTTVRMVTATTPEGLVVEIRDQGDLPLSAERLAGLRRILAEPFQVSLREQVRLGQIGLLVAARLAARHGIQIELHPQELGLRALVMLPRTLLTSPASAAAFPQAVSRSRRVAPTDPPALPPPRLPRPPLPRAALQGPLVEERSATPALPPLADPSTLPDGRPSLPRRFKKHPAASAISQHQPEPTTPAPLSVQPPSPELMARFASGIRRGQAGQQRDHTNEPETC
ncbi:sensor histidine kinase [Actinomadura bangladeshensis]|uniref:histidine kinase n=1 Tax=Actinomadura bangladeshensis TaxID=453573 RepID=A0A4R4NFG9_9ACTN|nr:ATP-binding protein [Actinomadura bangladeshensis]TDC07174.1 sensor histidine kinase [Actinomadura bangladeshensis]